MHGRWYQIPPPFDHRGIGFGPAVLPCHVANPGGDPVNTPARFKILIVGPFRSVVKNPWREVGTVLLRTVDVEGNSYTRQEQWNYSLDFRSPSPQFKYFPNHPPISTYPMGFLINFLPAFQCIGGYGKFVLV